MTAKFCTPSRLGMAVLLLTLGACGTTGGGGGGSDSLNVPTGTKPYRPYMVGVPYTISGKRYYPKENLSYDKVGVASWYGKDFHGRRTANGETYDMNAMTAAHPTLPMPTIVRVTNLSNNRTVLLRINDRGPFASNRIIDVSRQAATKLGFIRAGTARVRVTVLRSRTVALKRQGGAVNVARVSKVGPGRDPMDPTHRGDYKYKPPPPIATPAPKTVVADRSTREDKRPALPTPVAGDTIGTKTDKSTGQYLTGKARPVDIRPRDLRAEDRIRAPRVIAAPTTPATVRRIYVQAGAYTERDRAVRISRKLRRLGRTSVSTVKVRETRFFQVRVGPVKTAQQGDRVLARMVSMGYTGARIIVD